MKKTSQALKKSGKILTAKKPKAAVSKEPKKSKVTAKALKKAPLVIKEPFNHSTLVKTLMEHSELTRVQVSTVLETLLEIIKAHLNKKGPGQFKWSGLLQMKTQDKPAKHAHKGKNPFTGEEIMIAAKPAQRVIKIKPLKALKEAI